MNMPGSLIQNNLQFDPMIEIERICSFIREEVGRRKVHGVVIGMSGGLDSTTCAYLCKRCLPAYQIHLVSLPERDSSASYQDHARRAARELGLPMEEMNVAQLFTQLKIYGGVSSEYVANRARIENGIRLLGFLSGSAGFYRWINEYDFGTRSSLLSWIVRKFFWRYAATAQAFIFGKVRARMLLLSQYAMRLDCLQICTTDRSEYLAGFYDPHGDGVGDIAPLLHLYKTQIRELGRTLGVPDAILEQPSSGDIAAGLPNEAAFGISYEALDSILNAFSLGLNDEETARITGIKINTVSSLRATCQLAEERRAWPVRLPADQ